MVDSVIAYRQGDVVIVKSTTSMIRFRQDLNYSKTPNGKHLKAKAPRKGRVVLAEGEITGHAHTMGMAVAALLAKGKNLNQLAVTKAEYNEGKLIKGTVVETLGDMSLRFKPHDASTVIRFAPGTVVVEKGGVVPTFSFSLLTHDEHDAIPLEADAVYDVNIQSVAETPKTVTRVYD